MNHSCDPDCRFEGLDVVARRPVREGLRVMPCEEFLRGVTPGEPLPGIAE